jgi:hypothetical protein
LQLCMGKKKVMSSVMWRVRWGGKARKPPRYRQMST